MRRGLKKESVSSDRKSHFRPDESVSQLLVSV
jgi:hypothetical protein